MSIKAKIEEIIISPEESLIVALKKMDLIKRKLLLVVDKGKYFGLLSIGDIQRAIINNSDLNSKLSTVVRNDYLLARQESGIDEIKAMMLEIRAEFMPVVSGSNELINVYFWEDIFGSTEISPLKKFNVPVVVMAGGIGSRLKPLTNVLPKPLIPIGEKSIIEDIFDRFNRHGCKEFFISVNYKSDLIEYYLTQQKLDYKFEFFKEPTPLGTVGSLSLIKNKINGTFFITNCDILIEQDYSEILDYHLSNKNEITIIAALKHYPIPYGIVESGENGQLLDLKEKPELTFMINSGMYILEPHLLKEIPENSFYHITDLIEKVKKRSGNIGVFPVSEKSWKDIGDWNLYLNESPEVKWNQK